MTNEKTRETRLRRMAERQGYKLVKSPRRDPRAIDYGRWMIVNIDGVVAGAGDDDRPEFSLDDAEAWLTGSYEPDGVADPEPPVGHLPDFVADDADTNLRTVSLRWFMWGRDVKALLDEGNKVEAKSKDDKRAIRAQSDLMVKVARALKGAL